MGGREIRTAVLGRHAAAGAGEAAAQARDQVRHVGVGGMENVAGSNGSFGRLDGVWMLGGVGGDGDALDGRVAEQDKLWILVDERLPCTSDQAEWECGASGIRKGASDKTIAAKLCFLV